MSFSDDSGSAHEPWFIDEYGTGGSYPYDTLKHGTDPIPSYISSSVKKSPKENKASKKAVSEFYSQSDSDDTKYKETFKPGSPFCQEIAAKDVKAYARAITSNKKMKCYRCKDLKGSSTYERCSYVSQQPQASSREPRSNAAAEKTVDALTAASNSQKSEPASFESDEAPEEFRFNDHYFDTTADELPAQYEKDIDNCERVVKDSMVCMVCRDPKTNGKYEQCSYKGHPDEKGFAYSKSSSFGKPKSKPREHASKSSAKKARRAPYQEEEHDPKSYHGYYQHREEPEQQANYHETSQDDDKSDSAEDKKDHESKYVSSFKYPKFDDYKGSYESHAAEEEEEEEEDASPTQNIKSKESCEIEIKNGQTCSVCTDSRTGGKSEKCNYSSVPKNKGYRYSKSKSSGYPESQRSSDGRHNHKNDSEKTADSSDNQKRESSGEEYGSYESEPSTLDFVRSETEKASKKVKKEGDCREVEKDSMICTICKDPKTGDDFERCNYAYKPKDKVFAYSKSKSFGSPTKNYNDDYYGGGEERPEETHSSPTVIYPTGSSPLDYIPKTSERQRSNSYTTKKPQVARIG